jgi:hypothetical protein
MQAPIEVTERSGEVFLLDILSHRISDMGIFQQLTINHCFFGQDAGAASIAVIIVRAPPACVRYGGAVLLNAFENNEHPCLVM